MRHAFALIALFAAAPAAAGGLAPPTLEPRATPQLERHIECQHIPWTECRTTRDDGPDKPTFARDPDPEPAPEPQPEPEPEPEPDPEPDHKPTPQPEPQTPKTH